MRRAAKLLFPLVASLGLFGVYYFVRTSDVAAEGADRDAVLKALQFVAYLAVVIFVVRVIDWLAFEVLRTRRGQVAAPGLLREIVGIVLYAIFVTWALKSIFDVDLRAALVSGTVLAVVLGLALQDTLGNLFAGIALHMDDTFQRGDVIRSGEFIGVVEAIRWRGTRLRTFNNNVVILPNSVLARDRLEIFPRNNPNARLLQVHADYNVPPAFVISVLVQAVSNVDGVAHVIAPIARVAAFGEFALTYEVKYFMTDYSFRDRVDADIRKAVWYAFKRNGIAIPFPIRSLQRYTPPAGRLHPSRDQIREQLTRIGIFSPLSPQALEQIAGGARVHTFAAGETIILQNDAGGSMFIVYDGEVAVRMNDAEVARLHAGDFFGEMALLTGERRTADVVATSEVVAVEITRDALQPILQNNPELAAAISQRVIERRGSLDHKRTHVVESHATVLSRVRDFFGLRNSE